MSDGDKHFDATPGRIAKARSEGNVPRTQEFGANLAFAAAALTTAAIAPIVGALARSAIAASARGASPIPHMTLAFGMACLPLVVAAASGAAASVVQSQGLRFVVPSPKFERIAPVEGLKRMFSRETATHALRAIVAFAISGAATFVTLRDILGLTANGTSLDALAAAAWTGARQAIFAAVVVGLAFATLEFAVARRAWLQKLKMSLHDLKRDVKEHDGDPTARGRRKALHRALVRGALAKVNDASFVVVNPMHVAVALQYAPPAIPVPVVVVRATDALALRARELASVAGIPVIENVTLARALFRDARVGDPIPQAHFVAVAEIVAALARSGALR